MQRRLGTTRGFTLVEMMVSMGVGLVLLAAALSMFKQAVNATWVTSQKAEMQQDFRAAGNLMIRDISMAGSGSLGQMGLASNSVGLPFGTGILPVYPCSATTCNYINGAAVTYPTVTGAPYLYSITPGYNLGITINATEGPDRHHNDCICGCESRSELLQAYGQFRDAGFVSASDCSALDVHSAEGAWRRRRR